MTCKEFKHYYLSICVSPQEIASLASGQYKEGQTLATLSIDIPLRIFAL